MSREAFEKWAQGKSLLINIRQEMMYAAGYISVKEMAWKAWQAALQSGEPVAVVEKGVLNWIDGKQFDCEADLYTHPQPAVPESWRPIETAPKDSTPVLLGWYETWPKLEWVTESAAAGNADIARRGTGYLHGYATHWIPLPKPPVISAGKEVSDE